MRAGFPGWDGLGWNVSHSEDENKVYFFDENMNLLRSKEFGAYVENMYCVDGVLYVDAEKEYQSSDYITFTPLEDGASLAAPNRTSMFLWKGDKLYERNGTNDDTQLYYESRKPHELFAAGELLYYRKSWKSYYTDPATPNVLSVSTDGVYWTDFTLPDCFYELMNVVYLDGKIYIDCRYQTFVFDYISNPDYVRVKLGSRYLALTRRQKRSATGRWFRFGFSLKAWVRRSAGTKRRRPLRLRRGKTQSFCRLEARRHM